MGNLVTQNKKCECLFFFYIYEKIIEIIEYNKIMFCLAEHRFYNFPVISSAFGDSLV